MHKELTELIQNTLKVLNFPEIEFVLEHPNDMSHGDYATNAALIIAKKAGSNPKEIAEQIKSKIQETLPNTIEKIEIAGPGFINFYLSPSFFSSIVEEALNKGEEFGMNDDLKGQKIMFEYTDPNLFKVFHIGHLMSNTIGESLARLSEANGAKVFRVTYQSDVGLNVAKAIWGMKQNIISMPKDTDNLSERYNFLGKSYAFGNREYENSPEIKAEIIEINKQLFAKSSQELNALHKTGKRWSLESFDVIYGILGSRFDHYFFESDVQEYGINVVNEGLAKGVFEESDGAIVYKGEKKGLHTRVFINQHKLPTYEAKDLGLAKKKEELLKVDKSIIITAIEQKEYMKVVYSAMEDLLPDLAKKTEHITHGFLRLSTGKMSSRTGDVISADQLITDVKKKVESRETYMEAGMLSFTGANTIIAVGAIKYAILKQSLGKDIIFDFDKSVSFEGDSGPYLQYTHTRATAILDKAQTNNINIDPSTKPNDWKVTTLEKMIYQFSEIIKIAHKENAPHKLATFLIELSSAFNSFYAEKKIVNKDDNASGYRLALTSVTKLILDSGLYVLGINLPERM